MKSLYENLKEYQKVQLMSKRIKYLSICEMERLAPIVSMSTTLTRRNTSC